MREAFERWLVEYGYDPEMLKRMVGREELYSWLEIEELWDSWQAGIKWNEHNA